MIPLTIEFVYVHPRSWWPFAMAVHPKILTKGVNGQSIGRSFGPGPLWHINDIRPLEIKLSLFLRTRPYVTVLIEV